MKKKQLPSFIKNPLLIKLLQSRSGVILSSWLFQGMLYMDTYELIYKLFLDFVLTILLGVVLPFPYGLNWLLAWLIAHTFNGVFNYQPIAVKRHMGLGETDPREFIEYSAELQKRLNSKTFLKGAAAYGSLSSGNFKKTTDLDIRFILSPGFMNGLRASHYCFIERTRAFLNRFPLDLYAFTLQELMEKMRRDEVPIVFYDPENLIENSYESVLPFEVFFQSFLENYVKE